MAASTTTEPRDLDALLKLDTYQGMSDEEIEIVIEWRCQEYARTAEFKQNVNTSLERTALLAESYRERAEHAKTVLDALVAKALSEGNDG